MGRMDMSIRTISGQHEGRKFPGIVLTVFLMAMISAGCSFSAAGGPKGSKLQRVLGRGRLIVGTGSTNVPWHFKDEKGEWVGFDIEMGRILAKALFGDPNKVEF